MPFVWNHLSYVSICMWTCMYPYHIKTGLKIWSVMQKCIHHPFESLLVAIQMDDGSISWPGYGSAQLMTWISNKMHNAYITQLQTNGNVAYPLKKGT